MSLLFLQSQSLHELRLASEQHTIQHPGVHHVAMAVEHLLDPKSDITLREVQVVEDLRKCVRKEIYQQGYRMDVLGFGCRSQMFRSEWVWMKVPGHPTPRSDFYRKFSI